MDVVNRAGYDFSHLTKLDNDYMNLIQKILLEGIICENRTGINTRAISGAMIEHDMSLGFPLLTVKKTLFKVMAVELEGFIKGITDKRWYKERKCNIWNQWCNPEAVSAFDYTYENEHKEKATRDQMLKFQEECDDLGRIYGYQWNNFGGINQIRKVLNTLKIDPNNRRLIVSAWNPSDIDKMALPPCHVLWQINKIGDKLDLVWFQRSVDVPLGLPFNIASYALLLEAICQVSGYTAGKVIGMLSNCHIYENQIQPIVDGLIPQALESKITSLPQLLKQEMMSDIYEFDAKAWEVFGYQHCDFVKIPIAV